MKIYYARFSLFLLGFTTLIITGSSNCKRFIPEPEPGCKVYKTKGDYFDLVPIHLNEDKTKVIGFPDPEDLCHINNDDSLWQTPSRLINDYLLDHRGIGRNVAFLEMTYDDYMIYSDTINNVGEFLDLIRDDDPLLELYSDEERKVGWDTSFINDIIRRGELDKYFTRLK